MKGEGKEREREREREREKAQTCMPEAAFCPARGDGTFSERSDLHSSTVLS